MSALDLLSSFLLTLALHATVLLGAVWLAERAGWLRHTGWAELAWRIALFGALVSASLAAALPMAPPRAAPISQAANSAARPNASLPPVVSTPSMAAVEPGAGTSPVAALGTDAVAPQSASAANRVFMPASGITPQSTVVADRAGASSEHTNANAGVPAGLRLRPDTIALPEVIAAIALLAWAVGIVVGLLHLALQGLALRRLGRAANACATPISAQLAGLAHRLAGELGIAPPSLCVSAVASSPMVLPGARVLLPSWAHSLDATQQRALLAHELSHLQRHDPAWRIAQRLALLPLFFHPFAWHARHRLEDLAEDACDARAMQLLGSGRPLAECLAACLTHAGARAGHPALAVAMAGDAGPVVRRVKNLLEESRMTLRPLSPSLRRSALVIALVALVALPGIAVTTVAAEGLGDSISRFSFSTDDTVSYRHREDGYELRVKLVGKVVFNQNSTGIAHLGKGASFRLAETKDGVEREVRYFGKDGVIQREYRVDGDITAIDAAGRAWLVRMMPDVMRETGINAEARGKQLLASGGPDKLLAEIALIDADHAAARYLAVLFKNARLDAAQMSRALELAEAIDSDFEQRQALQAALDSQSLTVAQQAQVLKLSTTIGSDFEQAELLITLAGKSALQGGLLQAWRAALDGIGSDFEQRRVIEALLDRGDASPEAVVVALDSAHGISSDFETREVLTAAAPRVGTSATARAAYLRLAATIGSDFELREALQALLQAGPVDVAMADGVLVALEGIGSDFEAGEVLKSLAAAMPKDAALIERYRAATRRLGDHERGQAEKALDRFATN